MVRVRSLVSLTHGLASLAPRFNVIYDWLSSLRTSQPGRSIQQDHLQLRPKRDRSTSRQRPRHGDEKPQPGANWVRWVCARWAVQVGSVESWYLSGTTLSHGIVRKGVRPCKAATVVVHDAFS